MSTYALLLASGKGQRTRQDIPKQFINVYDKPIIIYTLENFQRHPEIDGIVVVCLDGWQDILRAYSRQYNIDKLKKIVNGGATVQESCRNGVFAMKEFCKDDDIVVVHDGIRPMVDEEVLSDVIATCKKYGNGVTSLPYNEQIFKKLDDTSTKEYIVRETLRRVQTPQAYKFDKIVWAYEKAFAEGIGIYGSSYTNTMMVDLGETLYFAGGSDRNIKITTVDDIELFKALLAAKKTSWLK
ncbi:MAG: 2-C-methyl-D-erythritol 4-phosphate cytidylyltransferase [Selenomonadaceae bacterium]|nr:2-C-methyl-D-erythritol 4-phosphate cytidylyltransferase [Selenomonadaceae bacterium]